MDLTNLKSTRIAQETNLGIYVWAMPDGRWIGDDDGNYLSVTSMRGDKSKMDALANVVAGFGIEVGEPLFLENRRKIDDEEFEYQNQRLKWGLVPDPLDIGNYKDEMANLKGAK